MRQNKCIIIVSNGGGYNFPLFRWMCAIVHETTKALRLSKITQENYEVLVRVVPLLNHSLTSTIPSYKHADIYYI